MRRQHWVSLGYSSNLSKHQQMAIKIENPWRQGSTHSHDPEMSSVRRSCSH